MRIHGRGNRATLFFLMLFSIGSLHAKPVLPPTHRTFEVRELLAGYLRHLRSVRTASIPFAESEVPMIQNPDVLIRHFPSIPRLLSTLTNKLNALGPEKSALAEEARALLESSKETGKVNWSTLWNFVLKVGRDISPAIPLQMIPPPSRDFRVVANSQDHLIGFPQYLIVPVMSERPLPIEKFNRLSPYGLSIAELTFRTGVADGMYMTPDTFLGHDLLHAETHRGFVVDSGITNFERHLWKRIKFRKKFESFLAKDPNRDKQKAYEILWFLVYHETAVFKMDPTGFREGLELIFSKPEVLLMERIGSLDDLGQSLSAAQRARFTEPFMRERVDEVLTFLGNLSN